MVLDDTSGDNCLHEVEQGTHARIPVDTGQVKRWIFNVSPEPILAVKAAIDPVAETFARTLDCPRRMLDFARRTGRGVVLDSMCNP